MAALPKWTDERTSELTTFVGDESPVSQGTVAEAADQLETTTRSVSSKLRKMGYEVELASAKSNRAFSEAQEATLSAFVSDNSGEYTMLRLQKTLKAEHLVRSLFKVRFFLWNLPIMLSQLLK